MEGIKPRSILEETEKCTQQKMQKKFLGLRIVLNGLYQIIVHLNTLTHPLRESLQKEVNFVWTGICNEAFEKLKLYMNSDTFLSYFYDHPFTRL